MKYILMAVAALALFSCKREDANNAQLQAVTETPTTPKPIETAATMVQDVPSDAGGDYETVYIVVADTSASYVALHKKMFALQTSTMQEIDTMGRYYNKKLGKIILPEDDEDEIYAGDYFARRYPSEALSLEYLDSYNNKSLPKTIALVTGIYESEKSADSACAVLRPAAPKAYKLKAELYMGCVH